MLLSVAICTRNRARLLKAALESVLCQPHPDTEVIVVENGCSDETVAYVQSRLPAFPNLRLISEPELGLSIARNRALLEARGQWVVFIDDDATIEPGWLAAYADFFAHGTSAQATCAGGPVTAVYDGCTPKWLSPRANCLAGPDRWSVLPPSDIPWGCNYAVRRAAAIKAGGFNPLLGHQGQKLGADEEIDLAERMWQSGGEIWWVPGARVKHLVTIQRLKICCQLCQAFRRGRYRVINRLGKHQAGIHRLGYALGRIAFAPFHCGLHLLMALLCLPFKRGRYAVNALVQTAYIVGFVRGLLEQLRQGLADPQFTNYL